jgi:hypothetical protein
MPEGSRFRLRRLSKVSGCGASLASRATTIRQGASVNPLFPNLTRAFAPLDPAMVACPAFAAVLATFRAAAHLHPDARGGVDAHAIRTLALPGAAGEPAPEGIHRDGRRIVGIFVVGRRDIAGGVTELHRSKDGAAEPLFRGVLQPGEGVVVNDREGGVFHYTSSIAAAGADGVAGARDVLVLLC